MGLFGRFSRTAPRLDADGWDPELARVRAAATDRKWPAMRAQLSEADPGTQLSRLVGHAADVTGLEKWFDQVVAAEPDSALTLLVSGARRVSWGWEARTALRAQHVSREQFRTFHERLRLAEEQLYAAAEREPEWVAPWYFLQMSGRGLEVGQEVARRRFEAAVRRAPRHLGAHQQQLQQICAKWGGSHEEMHAFARAAMLDDVPGGPLGSLVAIAHLEHRGELDGAEEAAYLRAPEVVASLHEAADRSIRHPSYGRPPGWTHTYNVFAMAFALAGEKKAAAELFDTLDGRVTEFPWQYIDGDAARAFRTWRARSGR
ncbi:hypothetical protein [uncultured Streptomyces sp.]|uniref:hypothetical protein n=1 Tax=uncultured Streptomyces sp. TaxID=174707 RepID=UPI0026393046|nr:hypothetical protein [uncultured Streptomyces sp.]